MERTDKVKINLLWTGGLDSTFRLCELSRQNVEVQPYYILDPTRGSIKEEQRAMSRILEMLRNHGETKADIKDVKNIIFSQIHDDDKIKKSYKFFSDWNQLGSQYDYLARFADQNNLKLEVGLEGSDRSKAAVVLKKFGDLQKHSYDSSDSLWAQYYMINSPAVSEECKDVFQNIIIPAHLFGLAKTEEYGKMQAWGGYYEQIAKLTWFCHRPVLGMTCGHCNPCRDALNEGMEWRVSKAGMFLGTIRNFSEKVSRRIKRILK
ncbi:MAG: hypothetical protein HDS87_05390 [Bacteroidales bacterium]|nr:hypothetical protein [Bacteroidales bacterium]